jgi:hypothetical protein
MTEAIKTNQDKLKALIADCTLLNDHIDVPELSDFDTPEELSEYIQERITEYEVIYYGGAMEYLSENDPSLSESLSLACEMGFGLDGLNSETLATLHIQNAMQEELSGLDFDDLFEETEEDDPVHDEDCGSHDGFKCDCVLHTID